VEFLAQVFSSRKNNKKNVLLIISPSTIGRQVIRITKHDPALDERTVVPPENTIGNIAVNPVHG